MNRTTDNHHCLFSLLQYNRLLSLSLSDDVVVVVEFKVCDDVLSICFSLNALLPPPDDLPLLLDFLLTRPAR